MHEPLPDCIPYSPPGAHIYPKAFYSIPEAAAMLRLSPQTIRGMIRDKSLRALQIRGRKRSAYRIPVSEVIRTITPL